MGDCKSIVAVFDKPWEEVLTRLKEEFGYLEEKRYEGDEGNREQFKFYDTRCFRLVSTGYVHFVMRTAEGFGPHECFIVNVFSRGNSTIIDFESWTSRFDFILSSELMKLLKKLARVGALIICGYIYGHEKLRDVFGDYNQFLLYERLAKIVKEGKLEVLPSDLTVVRGDILGLEDGLYELVGEPGLYVFVRDLGVEGYKVLLIVGDGLLDDVLYREVLEYENWFSLKITWVIFKRIGQKVGNEELLKRAEDYFKAQVGEDGR
ncbi:hypothetical protein [Thermococcus gammatolerans]|uniref:Uncharacterized protein n=1 Tax=Thermococcus gammatolerans (strain DSM 15229 / JCM 11827 / EJ3) TaxID=593117 RepID=C5A4M6_THEGJ|nr:hypothetical protein [Thermococcus gammatolerans]ACS33188.1 Conserved hypothetical protein [Thermococcus gammatolerans EJ3]